MVEGKGEKKAEEERLASDEIQLLA